MADDRRRMIRLASSSRTRIVVTVIVLLAGLIAFVRSTPPIVTDADIAVTEIYTDLALDGRLSLGPYSRFGWHHPGPLYFFMQAPFYAAASRQAAGLFAGAAVLNLLAIWLLVRTIRQTHSAWLAYCAGTACLLLAWRTPRLLASPWTAHAPVFPSVTLVVLCSAIGAGRVSLLPLAALTASFIVQTHVAYAPLAVALLALSVPAAILRARAQGETLAPHLWISAAIVAVAWTPSIADAIVHRGGNVAALWTYFLDNMTGQKHGWLAAWQRALFGLTGIIRADLALPWGGHFDPRVDVAAVTMAGVGAGLLTAIGWRAARDGRRFETHFVLGSFAAVAISVSSLTRVPDDILDHEVFHLSALGALMLAFVAATVVASAARRLNRTPIGVAPAVALVPVAFGAAALALAVWSFEDFTSFERRRTDRVVIVRMTSAIESYLAQSGHRKPLLTIEGTRWSYAAGVLLRLKRSGWRPAVSDEWLPTFTAHFRRQDDEDATIAMGGSPLRAQLDGKGAYLKIFEGFGCYVYVVPQELTRPEK